MRRESQNRGRTTTAKLLVYERKMWGGGPCSDLSIGLMFSQTFKLDQSVWETPCRESLPCNERGRVESGHKVAWLTDRSSRVSQLSPNRCGSKSMHDRTPLRTVRACHGDRTVNTRCGSWSCALISELPNLGVAGVKQPRGVGGLLSSEPSSEPNQSVVVRPLGLLGLGFDELVRVDL